MKPVYKILISLGAIIAVSAAGYFIWWLFIDAPTDTGPSPDGSLPSSAGSASTSTSSSGEISDSLFATPRALSDRTIFDYWLVPETGEVYYFTSEGYVYAVKQGPDLEISRQSIVSLNRTEPSPDGRKVLVSFGNPNDPQWAIFDSVDAVWRPLPREIVNAGWGRASNELIASVRNGNEINLSLVDISKTPNSYTVILRSFAVEGVSFFALTEGNIGIAERASSYAGGRVWSLNPTSKTLTLLLAPALGRTVKVDIKENVSYLGSAEGFSFADRSLQNAFPFFLNTLPDKCAAHASTTYCFVPRNLSERVTFPDDYFMHAFYSIDSLYQIAHGDGTITPFILGDVSFDASRVRAQKNTVYFIDRYTSLLYALAVAQ